MTIRECEEDTVTSHEYFTIFRRWNHGSRKEKTKKRREIRCQSRIVNNDFYASWLAMNDSQLLHASLSSMARLKPARGWPSRYRHERRHTRRFPHHDSLRRQRAVRSWHNFVRSDCKCTNPYTQVSFPAIPAPASLSVRSWLISSKALTENHSVSWLQVTQVSQDAVTQSRPEVTKLVWEPSRNGTVVSRAIRLGSFGCAEIAGRACHEYPNIGKEGGGHAGTDVARR